MNDMKIERDYEATRQRYADWGVDTDNALRTLADAAVSLNCWQGDDIRGFEGPGDGYPGGGLQVTGSYPGRAKNAGELQQDLAQAYSLIPGKHRLNLHAIYGEFGKVAVDRDEIEPRHFQGWIDWAREQEVKLDFNCTCFSHPKAESGFTLSHRDAGIRGFWIEHVRRCRAISAHIGKALQSACVHNLWIPDGSKDTTVDRMGRRTLLKESLDEIYKDVYPPAEMKDSLESKLFGIGSEMFVVGSHEFYFGYALKHGKMPCFDTGHFHPTESVADKISAVLPFTEEILLHISRGIRWDSDHIPVFDDGLKDLMLEIVRSGALGRVHIALDFFDASLNRVGGWVIGARAVLKSLLFALVEPRAWILEAESRGDYFSRLASLEEMKSMPLGAIWNYFCLKNNVPDGKSLIEAVLRYDEKVTKLR